MSGHDESLASTLRSVLQADGEEELRMADLFERLGDKGFGLFLVILSLPSALPIPAAGYSIPFGILLILLGAQMTLGRRSPWVPAWAGRRSLKGKLLGLMLGGAEKFFRKMERFIRPRFTVITSRAGQVLMGLLIIFMGTLMCIPIPTTNTAPAFVIFLIGVGLTEDDGLFCLLAMLAGIAATFLYLGVLWLCYQFIFVQKGDLDQFGDFLKETIKGLF